MYKALPKMVISRAVVVCWLCGNPEALRNVVFAMPKSLACCVIVLANSLSVPVRNSASALAISFADFVASAKIESRMLMESPAGNPSFDAGWRAAYLDTVILVSKEKSPLSSPRNTRYKVITFPSDAGKF